MKFAKTRRTLETIEVATVAIVLTPAYLNFVATHYAAMIAFNVLDLARGSQKLQGS